MRNVYLETDDDLHNDQVLWRYMDLSKFISMLETNALWLARADTFRDKHEGRFPDVMKKIIDKAYEKFDDDEKSIVKDTNDFQDYLIKNSFISCWHKNLDENMVMWEIYGKDCNAVAVQTTVESLIENIDTSSVKGTSLLLKNVIYQNASDITEVLPYTECFFRKRPHFTFEKEVRICLDTYSHLKPLKSTVYGHNISVHINGLIEKILIHPDSSKWFMDVVNSITNKYEIHAKVLRGLYGTK